MGVSLDLPRQAVADELGFSRVLVNAQYAQNSRGKVELAVDEDARTELLVTSRAHAAFRTAGPLAGLGGHLAVIVNPMTSPARVRVACEIRGEPDGEPDGEPKQDADSHVSFSSRRGPGGEGPIT